MRPWRSAVTLAVGVLLGASGAAHGHTRSVSYSSVELAGRDARVVLRVAQIELTRLPFGSVAPGRLDPRLADYATQRLRLRAGDVPCRVAAAPVALDAPRERAVLEWRVACPAEGVLTLESDFLRDVAPSHLHFARVRRPGEPALERLLSEAEPRWVLSGPAAAGPPRGSSLGAYVALGAEHIVTGYDHMAFLLALLLLARRASEVVTIVTGFTVAHSLTLALAALGRLRPEPAAIESLIGLSIALVAVENAWVLAGRPRALPALATGVLVAMAGAAAAGWGVVPALSLAGLALFVACYFGLAARASRPVRLRFAVAFCFGLVHGFGFAGVLAEMDLPSERVMPALLGFNLGVEAGQLAAVALVWPPLRVLAARRARWHAALVEASTAAVCALGVFWMVARAYA